MITLEQIQEKKEKHRKIMREIQDQANVGELLLEEIIKDKIQYAKESNLLSKLEWSFDSNRQTCLTCVTKNGEHREEIDSLFETDYHCRTGLEEGVFLFYSDGDMTLVFDVFSKMLSFCKECNIKIHKKFLSNKINKLRVDIETYSKELCRIEKLLEELDSEGLILEGKRLPECPESLKKRFGDNDEDN